MDFDFQVKLFTDQLVELLDDAKAWAAQEFSDERANWEQSKREYEATISGTEAVIAQLQSEKEEIELKLEALRSKIASLV